MDKESKSFHFAFIFGILFQVGLVCYCAIVKVFGEGLGTFSLSLIGIYLIVMGYSIYSLINYMRRTDLFQINVSLLLSVGFAMVFLFILAGEKTGSVAWLNVVVAMIEYIAAIKWYWANEWRFLDKTQYLDNGPTKTIDKHALKHESQNEQGCCPFCGAKYVDGAAFCNKCGKERT